MDGMKLTFRNIQIKDSATVYREIQYVVHSGEFPRGQLPTYKYFYYSRFKPNYGVIVENENGEFVSYAGIGTTVHSRSTNQHKACFAIVVIGQAYRRRSLARKLFTYIHGICAELGYVGLVGDTMITHLPGLEGLRGLGAIKVGIVPNTDFLGDQLTDSVITYDSYHPNGIHVPFTKQILQNRDMGNKL